MNSKFRNNCHYGCEVIKALCFVLSHINWWNNFAAVKINGAVGSPQTGLSLSFNSLVALLFTLVAKLSLCGWIVSTTGQFTCNVRGPSNILRHNMCYGSWPLIDSSVKDKVHVNVCGLTQVTLICILSSEVYNGSTGKNGRFLFTLFLLCLCFLVLLF